MSDTRKRGQALEVVSPHKPKPARHRAVNPGIDPEKRRKIEDHQNRIKERELDGM